jgi:acetyl esterase/lipase
VKRAFLIVIIVVLALGLAAAAGMNDFSAVTTLTFAAPNSPPLPAASDPGQSVVYCNIDNYNESMTIFLPNVSSERSFPAVIYVHGGGWLFGTSASSWFNLTNLLLKTGIAVASIDYYMPSDQPNSAPAAFPLNVEDVACAVRYLRANSAIYHIDPKRIGLAGDSAGGQLVSLEALAAPRGVFDHVGQWLGYSSEVQAVSDAYGPANLTDSSFTANRILSDYGPTDVNLTKYIFSGTESNLFAASPINYASEAAPPFIISQGWNDSTVPAIQSLMLYHRLIAVSDHVKLIMVQNADHGFASVDNRKISPSVAQIVASVVQFFRITLA